MSIARSDDTIAEAAQHTGSPLLAHFMTRLSVMHPAYFALVMATGIVAIACHLLGLRAFVIVLTWINWIAYPTLWIVFILRAILFPKRFMADWSDHVRAPGFFTLVAATGVLGSQAALLHHAFFAAQVLWWLCVVLWAACTYTIF